MTSPAPLRGPYGVRGSPTRALDKQVEEARRRGVTFYKLGTGQHNIPPPPELMETLFRIYRENPSRLLGYTPSQGIIELREAIAEDLESKGVPVTPSQIVVTAGGMQAMKITLEAFVSPGCSVLLPDPVYFHYPVIANYLGAKVAYYKRDPKTFRHDVDDFADKAGRQICAAVIITPDNPTGTLAHREDLKAMIDIARDHGFPLIVDEAHRGLVYEGEHVFPYSLPGGEEVVVSLNSFSKEPGIPGWRLGFIYAEQHIADALAKINEITVYSPPVPAQLLVLEYLRGGWEEWFRANVVAELRRRRDTLVNTLRKHLPQVYTPKPEGGMFTYVDFTRVLEEKGLSDTVELAKLYASKGVLTVPGTYFSPSLGERYIRLSFVAEPSERIEKAVEILANA